MLILEIVIFSITSFFVGLTGALVPGPMLTVTISDSIKKGPLAGPLVVSGHIITEILIMICLILGLGLFLGSKTIVFVIGTLGGLFMIYMGYRITKSEPENKEEYTSEQNNYGSFIGGIVTSISNPYFYIWWGTIGWAFLVKGMEIAGLIGAIAFLIGHWSADMGYYGMISVFTSKGKDFISERYYKSLMSVCGCFLIFLGFYFVLNAQISFF